VPTDLKGWVIAGLGFALGIAAAQLVLGTVGRGLKA
jgi:hypothetical protein